MELSITNSFKDLICCYASNDPTYDDRQFIPLAQWCLGGNNSYNVLRSPETRAAATSPFPSEPPPAFLVFSF